MADEEERDPLGPENKPEEPTFSVQKDKNEKQGIKSDVSKSEDSD